MHSTSKKLATWLLVGSLLWTLIPGSLLHTVRHEGGCCSTLALRPAADCCAAAGGTESAAAAFHARPQVDRDPCLLCKFLKLAKSSVVTTDVVTSLTPLCVRFEPDDHRAAVSILAGSLGARGPPPSA